MVHGESGSWRHKGAVFRAAILLMMLALLSQASPFQPVSAGPNIRLPVLCLSIDETEKAANVSISDCLLFFSGKAWMTGTLGGTNTLNLTSSIHTGWPSEIAPAYMVFNDHSNQTFNVTVTVPRATSSAIHGILSVHGNLTYNISNTKGVSPAETIASISIEPYLRLNWTADMTSGETGAGGESAFQLFVHNTGNREAPVVLIMPDIDSLQERGWTIKLVPEEANIPEGGWQCFTVRARPPGGLVLRDDRAVLNLTVATRGKQDPEPTPHGFVHLAVTVKADWTPLAGPSALLVIVVVLVVVAAVRRSRRRKR
jgi:hypothetical protein